MKTAPRKARERRLPGEPGTEERIAEAALAAFAAHGFDGVSTTEIAAQAGISQPMVHYHFATKEALWRAAVDRLFLHIGQTFPVARGELRDLDAAAKLRFIMRRFVLISARYPALGQLVMHEGSRGGRRLDWLVERYFRAHYAQFERLIAAAQAEGTLKPVEPWLATMLMTAAAAMVFNLSKLIQATWNRDPFDPEIVQRHADAVIDILFNGLLTTPK